MMEMEFDKPKKERAVLVGLRCHSFGMDENADEETLAELAALVETAGAETVAMTLQTRPAPDARTFIGEGKAQEVKELAEANEADLIIFDNELCTLADARARGDDRQDRARPLGTHSGHFRPACPHG